MQTDSPLRFIRTRVFRVKQDELAALGGVSRPRVSRFERQHDDPPFDFLKRLRAAAKAQGLPFDTDWFFETPAEVPAEVAALPVPVVASACAARAEAVPEDVQ